MKIFEIKENKKQFLPLLLLADEQESMIDKYIDKGTMYVLDDNGIKCQCVVTDEGNGILEIKNIATYPDFQGHGYARKLIEFVAEKYKGQFSVLQVGTGDGPLTVPFYEKCGFTRSHVVPDFSPITTTTRFLSVGCSWWIWFICGGNYNCSVADFPLILADSIITTAVIIINIIDGTGEVSRYILLV